MLLAWGTDLVWEEGAEGAGAEGAPGAWSNARAKRHARSAHVRDAFQLRVNAYRVLLTRGRDGRSSSSRPWPSSTPPPRGCRDTG